MLGDLEGAHEGCWGRVGLLGDVGQGSRMKLCVNMLMGQMMTSFSEGMCLAERSDLDPATFVEIVGPEIMVWR